MVLKFLKSNNPYFVLIFFLFALFFQIPVYFTDTFKSIKSIYIFYPIILLILSTILISLHAVGLNNLIYETDVIKKPNLVLSFVFLFLHTPFKIDLSMTIFSFLLLLFLSNLFKLYKRNEPYSLVFNSSLILAISSIFYPQALLFFILIFISLIVFRNINWRCVFLCCIGLLTPYIFLWTYLFLIEESFYLPHFQFTYSTITINYSKLDLYEIIWNITILVIVIISLSEIFRWIYKKSVRSRESFIIVLFYLIITIILFLFEDRNFTYLTFIPLSILITNFFVYSKSTKIAEVIFILFVFSSIFYRASMINM